MVYKNVDRDLIDLISTFLWRAGFGTVATESLTASQNLIEYLEEKGYSIIPKEDVYY